MNPDKNAGPAAKAFTVVAIEWKQHRTSCGYLNDPHQKAIIKPEETETLISLFYIYSLSTKKDQPTAG